MASTPSSYHQHSCCCWSFGKKQVSARSASSHSFIALYFESENELKFYNHEARRCISTDTICDYLVFVGGGGERCVMTSVMTLKGDKKVPFSCQICDL